MSYNYFNPSTANDLAKFQGTLAGIQAGNAAFIGVATAPTSIYNQAGFHVFTNDNGMLSVRKDADESLFSHQWYDQNTGVTFNFSASATDPTAVNSDPYTLTPISQQYGQYPSYNTTPSYVGALDGTQDANNTATYPWGNGVVVVFVSPTQDAADQADATTDGEQKSPVLDKNGEPVEIDADDIQELIDCGAYDSAIEALEDLEADGYTIPDDEQAKLGIYTDESEKMIDTAMDKLNITRDEAIEKFGDKLELSDESKKAENDKETDKADNDKKTDDTENDKETDKTENDKKTDDTENDKEIDKAENDKSTEKTKKSKRTYEKKTKEIKDDEYLQAFAKLQLSGMSSEEAYEALKKLGYEAPESIENERTLSQYSSEDRTKIEALMDATGCTVDEAIESLGVKPENSKSDEVEKINKKSV